ncbi:bifunctional folylpolyglutamate synthase/dihydrofolate synthase [Novosphingobium sp. JCM 18896]|uniref:bifunctional folylpolyglutamate synthase/dihydrofolate synthase n=1 Tax=Novosphingobium sp. JCM 18896 TaxID=2989731 RepID=UPI0022238CBE|nr:folylpolyglutamate synthase/dihydrofolate synthase family protein [Novosphingobium sp. JCM 18896]MCW1430071.1 bifunctional folylpolyglutamate synthase/dihydrofolate synthase [Novosphingobium sp. JCM 18896]
MKDFAISDDPAVQAQLDRLGALSLPQGRFGLETIREILSRLGDPQKRLPPTFHVAGTNGKGSTCAYLRAMLEAQGLKVHAATKPHLVRYNERIRLAGSLISDAELAERLEQVLDQSEDLNPSFFEVTAAATFLAFAEHPADACVIEVGLGGRFDATNVLERPAACGVATLGIDHEAFLLRPEAGVPQEPLSRIAFEKASIARPGSPLVTQAYAPEVTKAVLDVAMQVGARTALRDLDWSVQVGETIAYRDARGELSLPLPALAGRHQADNVALAVAMLRHQDAVTVSPEAMAEGIRAARWPARLQLLGDGPLTALVPGRKVWLDGGHNVDAGLAIARHFAGYPLHLVTGMLTTKDPSAIVSPLADQLLSISAVPAPGHDAHRPEDFAPFTSLPVGSFADVPAALAALPPQGEVLIAGSLYLAGEVLRLNRQIPD